MPTGTIIEAALNGGTTKATNPNVPRTPDEIAADGIACIKAGASTLHNHNDESIVGGPVPHDYRPYEAAWRQILAFDPDALIYSTLRGWSHDTTIEDRYSFVVKLIELGLLDMPPVDFGVVPATGTLPNGLPVPGDALYIDTPGDIDYMVRTCHALGKPIGMAIFEVGDLRTALAYHHNGLVHRGSVLKFFFDDSPMGVAGRGVPANKLGLDLYLSMIEGTDIPWMAVVGGEGGVRSGFYRMALERGGHISVGLERYRGSRTPTNLELVQEAAALCAEVGRPALAPAAAREFLGLTRARVPA